MTVYVEEVRQYPQPMPVTKKQLRKGLPRCYTYARLLPHPGDTLDELQAMARSLGIWSPPVTEDANAWYCLVPEWRDKAIAQGAVPVTRQEWMSIRDRSLWLHYTRCPACNATAMQDGSASPETIYCHTCHENTGLQVQLLYCTTGIDSDIARQLRLRAGTD